MQLQETLNKLSNVRKTSSGYSALCPSHSDKKNSLSITEENGKLLMNCFAGCSYEQIIEALNFQSNDKVNNQSEVEAIYDYTDENGEILYQKIRNENKNFQQRRVSENGGWIWSLGNVRRVPYQLPKLLNLPANYAFILAEGEKDADALTKAGLIATNHKDWKTEFNYLLVDRDVVIFQDHDESGVKQAKKVLEIIIIDAERIKVVDCFADEPLPKKNGKDVSDYLENNTKEDLLELIRNTPYIEKSLVESIPNGFEVVRLADVESEEISWLWFPFIPFGEFTIIEGIEGLGKTWLILALAAAIANALRLPFDESEPIEKATVLLLSAEDSLNHTIKPRLDAINANTERIYAINEVFSLQNLDDLIKFEAVIAYYKPKLVVFDPMFSYTGGRDLNRESDSRPLARKLIEIAQKFDCSIVGIRHIGKSKGNGDARAAGLGSVAWRASARSVLMVGKDEETGELALVQTKNNLAEVSKIAVGFEIKNGKFFWKDKPSSLTAEKMLAQPKDFESKIEQSEAVEFLREVLKDGEKPSKDIQKESRELGITNYAFKNAKSILGVESFKKGGTYGGEKGWYMRLPKSEEDDSYNSRQLQSNQTHKTAYINDLAEEVEF